MFADPDPTVFLNADPDLDLGGKMNDFRKEKGPPPHDEKMVFAQTIIYQKLDCIVYAFLYFSFRMPVL